MFIALFVYKYYNTNDLFFITVTLYGRAPYYANVFVESRYHYVTKLSDTYTTAEVSLPNTTRLLSVYAWNSADKQPGFLIKLSNGFITGSHWKCTHSQPNSPYSSLTYDDSHWPQAVVYNWTWDEHDLHPAQFISGELYGGTNKLYCRGWISKYSKRDD